MQVVVNHSEVRARMADYLEGHLALADRALLDAHLDGCTECSAEIAEIRATIAALRSLPEPVVPGDFSANVMRRIRAGESAPGWFERLSGFFESLSSARILMPVSAAALSVGLVLWGQQAGLLSTDHLSGSDRTSARTTASAVPIAPDLVSGAVPGTSASNDFRFAGVNPTGGQDTKGELPTDASFPVPRVRGEEPQTFSFQIVLTESNRPPYELDVGGPRVAPLLDGPATSVPHGFGTVERRPGQSLAVSRSAVEEPGFGRANEAVGGEPRSRDDWLEVLEASPAEFAARLSRLSLAERELWVDRLARHAAEQGSLDRVIARLQTAGGLQGRLLADDFAQASDQADEASSGAPRP